MKTIKCRWCEATIWDPMEHQVECVDCRDAFYHVGPPMRRIAEMLLKRIETLEKGRPK